jgi:hypothetical protein
MTLLDKILHHHGHEKPQAEASTQEAPQEESSDGKAGEELPPPPQYAPPSEPLPAEPPTAESRAVDSTSPPGEHRLTNAERAQYAPPPMNQQTAYGNTGLLAGAVVGHMDGAGMGSGMLDGQILGTMVGQRIHEAQNHAYWRERAMQYQAGDKNAVAAPPGPRTERAEAREERRKERWERRAERRADGSWF